MDKFPEIDEFYKTYWGKKPFIVRGAIDQEVFDNLIDGDSLAGLALEEDIKSRLVITEDNKWTCQHGPFKSDCFSALGDNGWSLLVQNVEQYHQATSKLLQSFNFSPRWLMDDIMASYSTVGGGVGPHLDSYHVFLVQGIGKRKWKISHTPIENAKHIDDTDLFILKDDFDGFEEEVSMGDVIYIPPYFAHQGTTTEDAMTFSVGFLGPQLSELLSEYSHYLEETPHLNKRYTGQGLDAQSAAFSIDPSAMKLVQNNLIEAIQSNDFATWMAKYFSISTHDETEGIDSVQEHISSSELLDILRSGKTLHRPEYIKIATTKSDDGSINLAVYGEVFTIDASDAKFIDWLNQGQKISLEDLSNDSLIELVTRFYNKGILSTNLDS